MYKYSLYGLTFITNEQLSYLQEDVNSLSAADIQIVTNERPINHHNPPLCKERVIPISQRKGDFCLNLIIGRKRRWFQILGGEGKESVSYTITGDGQKINATRNEYSPVENFHSFLLHPIFGFVLRLHGIICLHATVVIINNHAIAIVGHKGMGKSTTAASLYLQGYKILADDIAALEIQEKKFYVRPGLTQLRLSIKTAKFLCGQDIRFNPVWPNPIPSAIKKVFLGQQESEKKAFPLAAIYVLDACNSQIQPQIRPLSTWESLPILIGNTIRRQVLDKKGIAQEFHVLGNLVKQVPVRKIKRPSDISKVPDIAQAIQQDVSLQLRKKS